MKLRVLIADDEELSRIKLRDLLKDIPEVELCGEAENGAEAVSLAKELKPDLLILDIHMPGMDGFQVLEKLEQPPLFLFATAYDQYAVKAFEVESLDYLLKPFSKERLRNAIERARERFKSGLKPPVDLHDLLGGLEGRTPRYRTKFTSQKKGRVVILDAAEITHFMVEDTILFACRGHEHYTVRGTLESLEREIDPERFFRCHRSVIVNLDMIREIRPLWKGNYVIELKDERSTRLPLSRRQARILKDRFPW